MKNGKESYKNNKFKISAPTWNEKCEVSDWSYCISDIPDYFECILKKHVEKINDNNLSTKVCKNKIESRTTFKSKTGYYLEPLAHETVKLLGSITDKITKDKNGENMPHLEITEVVLVLCNIVKNDYQQHSKVLYTFVL